MKPVVTVEQMRAMDEAAQRHTPIETLAQRAGHSVAVELLRRLGGASGRRVVVVAGKGHNGGDGRIAADLLRRRGALVKVVDAGSRVAMDATLAADAVIDAAYGTGFRGEYVAPEASPLAFVIAVDIPSGVDGDTGIAHGLPMKADVTVTFVACKPGLFLADGPELSGEVVVADIGIDTTAATAWLMEDSDVTAGLPARPRNAHKWMSAVYVVAGSVEMGGAAALCSDGALHSGAGLVCLGVPGAFGPRPSSSVAGGLAGVPREVVWGALPAEDWAKEVLANLGRYDALVVGPGLGRDQLTVESIRRLVELAPVPLVVDADGLAALGSLEEAKELIASRKAPCVLTPHDGELERLSGRKAPEDRLAHVLGVSKAIGAVVLSKGSTTVVASPGGEARLVTSGSPRLATPGTGDVLSGVIGAFLARGVDPLQAACLGAHVHGRAASLGHSEGFVAGDLPGLIAQWLSAARDGEI